MKIRIAMVAPPFGEIGGPEVMVQSLTEALLKKGVDVTLFAPADWKTKAKHIPTLLQSLWNMKNFSKHTDIVRGNLIVASQVKVLVYENNFDIIHLHSQRHAYPVGINAIKPCVLSLHSLIDPFDFNYLKKASIFTVALSQTQKGKLKTSAVIWNGLPVEKIRYSLKKSAYFVAIGRLNEQKGIDQAIQIAKRANVKLFIFGRIGNSKERQKYFASKIKPSLDGKQIVYKGEVSHNEVLRYLRGASGLLFPITKPEVCPMTVIESLACGTPIIGSKIGPLTEMLKGNKKIAFLSNSLDAQVSAVKKIEKLDRLACRKYAEDNFSSSRMAEDYIQLYKKILRRKN